MSQTIAGGLVGGALGAYGKKPALKPWEAVDPTAVQGETIAGNLLSFDQASQLSSKTNSANQSELNRLLDLQLPGGSSIIKENIISDLQGKLTPGELSNLKQAIAEGAVGRGTGMGGGSNFDLGAGALARLTASSKKIERGFSSAMQWMQASVVPQMGVQNMFFSPQQRLTAKTYERDKKQQYDLLQSQIDAAPDPNMVALAEGFDNFFKTWSSVGTGMFGGMGGGGAPKSASKGGGNNSGGKGGMIGSDQWGMFDQDFQNQMRDTR